MPTRLYVRSIDHIGASFTASSSRGDGFMARPRAKYPLNSEGTLLPGQRRRCKGAGRRSQRACSSTAVQELGAALNHRLLGRRCFCCMTLCASSLGLDGGLWCVTSLVPRGSKSTSKEYLAQQAIIVKRSRLKRRTPSHRNTESPSDLYLGP